MPFASGLVGGNKPDLDTVKNIIAFRSSGSTVVPPWATKVYYAVIGGGGTGANAGFGSGGVAGGRAGGVNQGSTSVSPGITITVSVGGAGANSTISVPGVGTFTAAGAGGVTSNNNGPILSSPFDFGFIAGAGSSGAYQNATSGTEGGGGRGAVYTEDYLPPGPTWQAKVRVTAAAGKINTGGGGGGGAGGNTSALSAPNVGGSGVVFLYFA